LRQSYYETWLVGLEKQLLDAGLITAAELEAAIPSGTIDESLKERVIESTQVARRLAQGASTSIELESPPRFQLGERVLAVNRQPTGHTREPRYVRGHVGVIHEYLGAHIFPDRHAEGVKQGQHLYNVRFDALELWGNHANQASSVYVALWEPYLEAV
jgi:nitrile hydratase